MNAVQEGKPTTLAYIRGLIAPLAFDHRLPVTTLRHHRYHDSVVPPGSTWTDYFTGRRYAGGTTGQITTTLDTVPVFVRSGG